MAGSRRGANKPLSYGRYAVQREIAAGAMASVFAARDPVLLRPVAIKVLHDTLSGRSVYVQRFFQEARTVAQLQSPHIVEVHDFGEEEGKQFLVMEFVDGLSLQGVLDSLLPESMDPIVAAALVCQAAEGLHAAVRRGVVHRDLKPANLLISPQGYLKIADFGISHLRDHTQTGTGVIVGSACYMSPEQANGEKGITAQSDMFSLGTVFYRCLSGIDPFYTETYAGTLRMIVDGHHEPLHQRVPGLDPELYRIVETLLQKSPQKRGSGASWVKAQLREYLLKKRVADPVDRIRHFLADLSGRGVQTTGFISPIHLASAEVMGRAHPGAASSPPHSVSSSWRIKAIIAAVICLAALAAGIWWAALKDTPSPRPSTVAVKTSPSIPPQGSAPKMDSLTQSFLNTMDSLATPSPSVAGRSKPKSSKPSVAVRRRTREHGRLGPAAAVVASLPPKANPSSPAPEKAYLTLHSAPPFADVTYDGKEVGPTPLSRLPTQDGPHHLILEATQTNSRLDTTIDLQPGETALKLKIPGAPSP